MGVDEKERERTILDVTADLLLRHGYNKLTMSDVADAVGLNRKLVYLLFPSKDALVEAVLLREMNIYLKMWNHYLDSDPLGGSVGSVYRSLLVVLKQLPLMTAMYIRDEQTFGKYLSRPGNIFAYWPPDPGPTRDFLQVMQAAGVVRQDINTRAIAFILDALAPSILVALSSHKRVAPDDSNRQDRPSFAELVETVAEFCELLLAPQAGANLEAGKALMRRQAEEMQAQLTAALNKRREKAHDEGDASPFADPGKTL
ncbi:TetR/AcrR family transcriptional regulator [Ktedonosporobacter rubrisoli]|uniref:TetR/AcrR family transcriptional regulator n=1 Tax=Ktedonosporobacter rubrisoli TaxID=2509675 RepID=A0A4P6K3Y9_KTERU|nr:helix-turn-helix domain-containing protein [Ktedonosporobacter rubrisoli]QBD82884.1 TetR/AcrR family transcriptional regulator [Ktedonosporobacter rubrisoli]